ncbi:hypothetical protein AGABI2DRAFT_136484 [Agaricus bisporus var. bisporus H97]|uniref:hypothetical protein n=1 Tax=Agaricus bisporus var. bisporus (strain H97 / ATCC MYA-4626 / FGSC 10389) TaxID=936046 RepID=UPI00029F668D|nr:hypothetical protein AGABI2DRAFT_136484 [Agaricus bisporus var. bisporus H97]EKV47815.1 hypothetical protein AGABI2DRAFT_136484 [Agaricus bisporus var. bisporus H97]
MAADAPPTAYKEAPSLTESMTQPRNLLRSARRLVERPPSSMVTSGPPRMASQSFPRNMVYISRTL